MRNVFLLGIISLILISSCKKEPDVIEQPTTKSIDYMPLTVGNFWVYENYSIDTLGNETVLTQRDSIVVDRDTIIGAHTYFILEGTSYPTVNDWGIVDIVRDSSDYLVNEKGKILFSSSNFSDILCEEVGIYDSDTLYTLTYQMETVSGSIIVPAGTFDDVLNYKGILTRYISTNANNPEYFNNYFAPDIGKIVETWSYLSIPTLYQRRLINYNIL
ncbi:MAG: hypothetical protein OEU76_06565 [Cyclobacteriaceae bacterium]|nr:hypothetical protein [Cyclobacteriaceae bacterium]